jgi:hypothetical protein
MPGTAGSSRLGLARGPIKQWLARNLPHTSGKKIEVSSVNL